MSNYTKKKIVARPYCNDDDFLQVRDLLVRTYPITPVGFNWEVRRWDGFRFYNADPTWNQAWERQVRLWETIDGELIGAVHPEGTGQAHIQVHPEYRHIEEEILIWAENNLTSVTENGRRGLSVFTFEYDSQRLNLLQQRGYIRSDNGEVMRRLQIDSCVLPQSPVAEGYAVRTVRPDDDNDCRQIAKILNASFNRDFHTADEFRSFATHAVSYREGLDLVAEATDGTFAAYVGAPYNEVNRYAVFEPVCTHPDHRRKGLARSLMYEGLLRLKNMGGTDVYVGTGDRIAVNQLYQSIGFEESHTGYCWRKNNAPGCLPHLNKLIGHHSPKHSRPPSKGGSVSGFHNRSIAVAPVLEKTATKFFGAPLLVV